MILSTCKVQLRNFRLQKGRKKSFNGWDSQGTIGNNKDLPEESTNPHKIAGIPLLAGRTAVLHKYADNLVCPLLLFFNAARWSPPHEPDPASYHLAAYLSTDQGSPIIR